MVRMNRRDLLKGIAAIGATSLTATTLETTPAGAEVKPEQVEEGLDVAILRCGPNDTLVVIPGENLITSAQHVRQLQNGLDTFLPLRGVDNQVVVMPPGTKLQVITKQ